MATFTLWIGVRSPTREEYGLVEVEVEGEEIFAVSFDDGDPPPVDYRVFETASGLVVYYIEKRDGEQTGGIDIYKDLADFLMKELPD